MRPLLALLALCTVLAPARGGLYYSGEAFRELPARWRGFLPDHRALRLVAAPLAATAGTSLPLRDAYTDAALRLAATARTRALTADEAADLGALYVRLGQPQKAVDILRPAARAHPTHFHLAANLGTAWQLVGDLEQAAAALEDAARLAPKELKDAEAYHLKLVRLRAAEGRRAQNPTAPDDLFGVRFVGERGAAEAGGIATGEKKKLPANAVAVAQQLALWLPADGRLVWLLGELANAVGDARTAANLLDGCVSEFNMASPELRARRQLYRTTAAEWDKAGEHDRGKDAITFRSPRALVRGVDPAKLPAIKLDGVTPLPWVVVGETEIGPRGKPVFLKYLEQLDGKRVSLTGFMSAGGATENELTGFLMTENAIGCWFCETPGPTQVVTVDLTAGATTAPMRAALKVTGTLKLNRTDPEAFPVTITDATIGAAD
ncbi:DUF3299 domain-containing protein [Fimbriiglobus ruber]|uniref:Uncharacterized protein n=1 Tax=Fimbriiglobus ruber TaxID=1908690 RepID=A0A225D9M0_9BACT|nr:DUF3299 domain-containing protein [Fimbriiglobus ruber]OWK38162.1 hypothetical protein FRUB_07282 [Fimbriiglobus ruber]